MAVKHVLLFRRLNNTNTDPFTILDLLQVASSARSSKVKNPVAPIRVPFNQWNLAPGDIPSFKLIETDLSFAFLDIGPLSKGHALVIPKYHAEKLHELPDEHLTDILPIAKKIAVAQGLVDYNILQNNGRIAHQEVDHVHFHIIPKPSAEQGLTIGWPSKPADKAELQKYAAEIAGKL
ncbi:Adenosine 5'-monophosphoramidase [Tephrocybe rancida]|nr:Adenosine 5'-monophosphoramidase [Tephrocybe rancida]